MSEVLSSLPSGNVVSALSAMDDGARFATFLRLVSSSGLGELLSGEEGPITVFAPEEEAFEGWGEGELEDVEKDKVMKQPAFVIVWAPRYCKGAIGGRPEGGRRRQFPIPNSFG